MTMTDEQKEYVSDRVDQEGLDYCLRNYSNFEEISDDTFHMLRRQYIQSAEDFEKYIELRRFTE